MAESPLSVGWGELSAEIGQYLGWSRTSSNWSSDQTDQIEALVDAGLRQFYSAATHGWSFMKLTGTITTVNGTESYDLADDFGSMDGYFTFPSDTGYPPLEPGSQERIRGFKGSVDLQGIPTVFSVEPKSTTATDGQRWQATLYPTPSTAWVLTYRYNVLPAYRMRSSTPYPYGGQDHAETIIQSCLAMAEKRMNHERGFQNEEYQRLVQQSLMRDRLLAPGSLGYNGDNSDSVPNGYIWDYTPNTYNGVTYD